MLRTPIRQRPFLPYLVTKMYAHRAKVGGARFVTSRCRYLNAHNSLAWRIGSAAMLTTLGLTRHIPSTPLTISMVIEAGWPSEAFLSLFRRRKEPADPSFRVRPQRQA